MNERIWWEEYDRFPIETLYPWCWSCGRTRNDQPDWWYGAPWCIERAHIVNQPRKRNRRAVILLCSLCHRVQHGANIKQVSLPAVTISEMLWLKRAMDPENYLREWLQKHHVGILPRARMPQLALRNEYCSRQGHYPSREKKINT